MAGIVSTSWLADNLDDANLRILDCRGSFSTYEEAHIPGAQMLHIETLRMSEDGIPCRMHSTETLGVIFGRLGITRETPVVLYASNPQDHLSATFVAWNLEVTGNPNTLVLDGGLHKWEDEEHPVTQTFPCISTTDYRSTFDESIFSDWRHIRENLDNAGVVLVDTRTRGMYTGAAGPTQRRGHIPGAVLHNYVWDFQRDGSYQSVERLRRRYESEGITADKEIITYCVTGREGSAAWFVLKHLLGYPNVRLYQASMSEWTAHPELPVVTGNSRYGEQRKAA